MILYLEGFKSFFGTGYKKRNFDENLLPPETPKNIYYRLVDSIIFSCGEILSVLEGFLYCRNEFCQ